MFPCPYHAADADDDEGDAENLTHVEWQRGLEGFLDLLRVLDEETEGEDVRQAQSEIPARADALRILLVQPPHQSKQYAVGDSLVELARMAWQ